MTRSVPLKAGEQKVVNFKAPPKVLPKEKPDPPDASNEVVGAGTAIDTSVQESSGGGGTPAFLKKTWFWTGVATVAFAGIGVGFGLSAKSKHDEWKEYVSMTQPAPIYDEAKEIEDDVKSKAIIANISFAVAGAGAIATGVLLYLDLRSNSGEGVQVESSDTGATVGYLWSF
jgi:hypothetical protein